MSAHALKVASASKPSPSPARQLLSRLWQEKPVGAAAAMVFLLFVFCGVFADWLAPYGFNEISMLERRKQ